VLVAGVECLVLTIRDIDTWDFLRQHPQTLAQPCWSNLVHTDRKKLESPALLHDAMSLQKLLLRPKRSDEISACDAMPWSEPQLK
jgi:hypothetical protein